MWKDIGLSVSTIIRRAPGFCTMTGPMNTEVKQRKVSVHRKYIWHSKTSRPDKIIDVAERKRTDTDMNMATIFDILRKDRKVRLEKLVLNRKSFSLTVENLFALSFLVKDGRVQMTVNDNCHHLVSPRNDPAANVVMSGEVSYSPSTLRIGRYLFLQKTHTPSNLFT